MKKARWFSFPITCLFLMLLLMITVPGAKADANLMDNGSVAYAWIKEPDELRAYIENEGIYASYDYLEGEELSNVYKIVLDEPGQLIFAPLSPDRTAVELFSDYALKVSLGKFESTENSRGTFTSFSLEPGTYYYRSHHKASVYHSGITVFMGFLPDSSVLHENKTQSAIKYPEVNLVSVSSPDELASYIDNNGEPTSSDRIEEKAKNGLTPTYQFTINEKGTLYVCPIATLGSYVTISVFGNQDLSSRLLHEKCDKSSYGNIYSIDLDPGTYYYFLDRWNSYYQTNIYAFLGFTPKDVTNRQDRYFTDNVAEGTIEIPHVQSAEEFRQFLQNGQYVFKDATKINKRGPVRSFSLAEQSLVYWFIDTNRTSGSSYDGYLFSDKNLISKVGEYTITTREFQTYILDAGTYYYYNYNHTGTRDSDEARTYIAYTPASDAIRIESTALSDDKKSVTVIFDIADEYNPDQYKSQVRIENGVVKARSILNADVWKDDTRDNAIESHEFIATENGVYTARISGNSLSPYLLTFEVTGIESDAEAESPAEDTPVTDPAGSSEDLPVPAEQPVEEPDSANEATVMTASEMRKYIRVLEDQIEDLGLELPEFSADTTQEAYLKALEQVLRDNGYDF